jgi:hypothetical protein
MRIETRVFGRNGETKHLLLIAENEIESHAIDIILGQPGSKFSGEVALADGYAEHYLRLKSEKKLHEPKFD